MTGHTQQKAPAVLPQGTLQLQQTRQRWQGSTLVPRIKSRLAQATDVVSKQASQARLLQQTVRPAQWENNATQAAEGRLARTHLTLESKTDSASRKSSLQPFKPSPAYAPLRPALADLPGPDAAKTLVRKPPKQSLSRVKRAAAAGLPQHLADGSFLAHFTPMGQRPNNKLVRVPAPKLSPARHAPLLPSKVS